MAHFCGFIKLIFLLLMLARIPSNESRPLKGNAQANSDLIAGNEFLKLFLEQDQLDKDFNSSEYVGGGGGGGGSEHELHKRNESAPGTKNKDTYDRKSAETGRRSSSGRRLKDNAPAQNQAGGQLEDSKQVVKLVTSGSKIVFLEDYDENDAILDAEVRDIDLKKEVFKNKPHSNLNDYKVVAVSVSSSSQRGTTTARDQNNISTTTKKLLNTTTTKTTTTTTTTTKKPLRASSTKADNIAGDNFINRSHKSEFSIEEVEPLTMAQHRSRKTHTRHRSSSSSSITSVADTLEVIDSENSASINIHNILAAPLQQAASARSSSMMTSKYHNGPRNVTINHETNLHSSQYRSKPDNENSNHSETQQTGAIEDQLLPFQTVIYHDTKAGHGPQSRSISYSSISQNVEDLKKWQQSGILAEARRNVSESLKPMPRTNSSVAQQQSESVNFYSQPSKMYSEPSKFYSEPAKVYSEPSKVYGEPEKFYSEPSKVYSQPSKYYSEPSKVYSQPAKVYSEPAKTYWPLTGTTTTASDSVNTLIPPTNAPTVTTTLPPMVNILHHASRKPAIVSRIAFGEAHSTTTSTTTTSSSTATTSTSTSSPLTTTATFRTYGTHGSHQYTRTYSSHRNPSHSPFNNENSSTLSSSLSSSTPSRRILFNLDRLPYDLLNAPESTVQQQQQQQQQQQLSQQSNSNRPQQTLTYNQQQHQQQQQQQQQQRHNINPCLESAVSSLFSSSSLSAHPSVVKQRQQPDSQQHSNQNAKGLPNGDLVRCVAEISNTPSAATDDGSDGAFTTERSHMEELFTPTPEQNYEIEESVSVMTNGRAHGGGGGRNSFTQPTISPLQQQQYHGFKPNRQQTRIHFGTNVDNQQQAEVQQQHQIHHHQLSVATGNRHNNNNAPDYNDYDGGDGGEENDGSAKNSDYEDDENNTGRGSPPNGNNDDDEDSKVAYVVEGRNYRKYRVEEKTDDGFIVGEYGVVDHNDGNLRGVRYTADSTINPSLIQKALLTFLKLK